MSSSGLLTWTCPLIVFILIPFFDFIFNIESFDYEQKNHWYYDLLLYLQLPIQYLLIFFFLTKTQSNILETYKLTGMILSMGINCGVIGINVAHELGHRSTKIEKIMAKTLLISSLYYQFFIDHNKGHHKYVSTPKDPSSAKRNQNLYSFIISSFIGTFKSALKIDRREMLIGIALQIGITIVIYSLFGVQGSLYFIFAAFIGSTLLECVNYIEHYGLERKLNESGRYEKIKPIHSWNSNHFIGRGVLFNLSRHSDHHYMVNKKYPQLQNILEAPQMPTGYPGMILLSLIPPIWFKVMNKRIDQ